MHSFTPSVITRRAPSHVVQPQVPIIAEKTDNQNAICQHLPFFIVLPETVALGLLSGPSDRLSSERAMLVQMPGDEKGPSVFNSLRSAL